MHDRDADAASDVMVMLLDIRKPGKSGLEVMAEAAKPLPFPVIAMTGNVDVESVASYRYSARLEHGGLC